MTTINVTATMHSMQLEDRETTLFYVQWLDARGRWVTLTDDLNRCNSGYMTEDEARTIGVDYVCSGLREPMETRIVKRVTTETALD